MLFFRTAVFGSSRRAKERSEEVDFIRLAENTKVFRLLLQRIENNTNYYYSIETQKYGKIKRNEKGCRPTGIKTKIFILDNY